MNAPDSIQITVLGVRRAVTKELALRRLFNRGIDLTFDGRARRSITSVTHGLVDVGNSLLAHYRDAVLTGLKLQALSREDLGRQARLFLQSSRAFLPPDWKSEIDRAVNEITALFFNHLTRTMRADQLEREEWEQGWLTEVVPQIVALGARYSTEPLNDPFHPDFGQADALFNQEMTRLGMRGGVNLARRPCRHPDTPESVIEYATITPRGYFHVDLLQNAVVFDPNQTWSLGTWELWPVSTRKETQ